MRKRRRSNSSTTVDVRSTRTSNSVTNCKCQYCECLFHASTLKRHEARCHLNPTRAPWPSQLRTQNNSFELDPNDIYEDVHGNDNSYQLTDMDERVDGSSTSLCEELFHSINLKTVCCKEIDSPLP